MKKKALILMQLIKI